MCSLRSVSVHVCIGLMEFIKSTVRLKMEVRLNSEDALDTLEAIYYNSAVRYKFQILNSIRCSVQVCQHQLYIYIYSFIRIIWTAI